MSLVLCKKTYLIVCLKNCYDLLIKNDCISIKVSQFFQDTLYAYGMLNFSDLQYKEVKARKLFLKAVILIQIMSAEDKGLPVDHTQKRYPKEAVNVSDCILVLPTQIHRICTFLSQSSQNILKAPQILAKLVCFPLHIQKPLFRLLYIYLSTFIVCKCPLPPITSYFGARFWVKTSNSFFYTQKHLLALASLRYFSRTSPQ